MEPPKCNQVLAKVVSMHNVAKVVYVDDDILKWANSPDLSSYVINYDQYSIFLQNLRPSARELFPPPTSSNVLISLDKLIATVNGSTIINDICGTIDAYNKSINDYQIESNDAKKNIVTDMKYIYLMFGIITCTAIVCMIINAIMIAIGHCSLLIPTFSLFILVYIGIFYCVRIYCIISDYQHKYLNILLASPDV